MLVKLYISLVLAVLAVGFSASEKFSYDGFSLIRLTPKTAKHVRMIREWQHNPEFDSWGKLKGVDTNHDVLLSPEHKDNYTKLFASANLPFETIVENIQSKIEEQETSMKRSLDNSKSIIGSFARHSEVQSFIRDIIADNSDIASSYVAGKTHEQRDLTVLVLKTESSKKSIWIDCGIHAREWISPATCVWMIDRFVSEYRSGDATTVDLLNHYEIHILPIMNPDGYEYSHTSYRFWRKNRTPNRGSSCVGTDLNRNSGYQWMTGGSSSNPCSDIYAGPSASSELEIKAVQSALNAKLGNWDAYLTLHTYGQWIFTPWGYTFTLPSDYDEMLRVAQVGANAIQQTNGNKWVLGSSTVIFGGPSSGGSEDWAKGVANIKYSYCFELRPGQYGTDSYYGFALPADRIPLAGEETYQGIKSMLVSIKA